jgi:AraC-like DNA-binding protein
MVLHFTPDPALQHFVKRITLARYQLDQGQPRLTTPFPPQPVHCLYFYPYDKIICRNYADQKIEEQPHAMLVGPQLSRVDLTMGYNMLVIMVFFQPGGMHRLLGIPMAEMINQPFDAASILGKEINEITEQLNEVLDFNQMIAIVQNYLLYKSKKIKTSLPIEQILAKMTNQGRFSNVDHLAKEACVSVRQLERQFKERIGISPKLYARQTRFSKAWIMHETNPTLSWSQIAYACHYADQMHMIRDFKEFVNGTPSNLKSDLEKTHLRLQGTSLL